MNIIRTLVVLCATVTAVLAQLTLPAACGVDMGCYSNCNGDSCTFVVTYRDNGNNSINFGLHLNLDGTTGDRWIALGLSDDQIMASDSVTHCIMNGSTIVVGKSYNNGHSNAVIENHGLLAMSATVQDNVLSCTYTQNKTSSNFQVFNLTQTWFLLVAHGGATAGVANRHSNTNRESSSSRIDFAFSPMQQTTGQQMSSTDSPMQHDATGTTPTSGSSVNVNAKVQGGLVLFAWVFFASIGIVLLR